MNRSPLFPFLVLFAVTISFCFYTDIQEFLPDWMLFTFMLLIVVFSIINYNYLKSASLTYLLLSGFIISFGAFVMHDGESGLKALNEEFLKNEELVFVGEVSSDPSQKNGQLRFQLKEVHKLSGNTSNWELINDQLIVNAKGAENPLKYGDQVVLKGRLSKIKNKGNPGEFDYALFMRKKGVEYQVYTESKKLKKIGESEWSIFVWADRTRDKMIRLIDGSVREQEAPIAKAILLGYKNDIDNETRNHYAASGASHILAVSGMHVGILVLIISMVNKLWARTQKLKIIAALFSLLIIWAFVFLTGFAPSIVRSGFMFSLLLLGNLFQRSPSSLNIISLSAFFLLIIEPLYLFDVGFQLSFSAIFGIFYIYPKLNKRLFVKTKILRWFYQLSLVSISAQIATLPFTLFYFKQFPTYFLLSNPISTIGATLILVVGVLFFLGSFSEILMSFFGKILTHIIEAQNYLMEQISGFKFALIKIKGVGIYEAMLLAILVLLIFFISYTNKNKSLLIKGVISISIIVALIVFQEKEAHGKLVVFNSRSDNLLLEIDDAVYFYETDEISKELHNYMQDINRPKKVMLSADETNFYQGVFQLGNQRVLILSKENNSLLGKVNADLILCTSKTYVPKEFDSNALWILPNSLGSKQRRIIEQLLIENDQMYYDVKEKGAFELKF